MDYYQRPRYQIARPAAKIEQKSYNIYFKQDGKLVATKVGSGTMEDFNHVDAILAVQDSLLQQGESWDGPVLALVQGGKQ